MKLATLRNGTRDGMLVVVRRDGSKWSPATSVVPSLQAALDRWGEVEAPLRALAASLERGDVPSEPLDTTKLHAPLPRAYEWVDGSAYINHIVLVRKARGAEPPETLRTDPLVYQGGSSANLGPRDPIPMRDAADGLDFESEICAVLGDTPMGTRAQDADRHIALFMLANDVTLRNLVPNELAKGFGFFQSKPATAFSPFAITKDELGDAYRDGRVHLKLCTWLNGKLVGDTDAGPEMHFSFFDLVQHITKTRAFAAGTILGSGTVSNQDPERGVSCLAERRTREVLEGGKAVTPFLAIGDRVAIEMKGPDGVSLFGRIEQEVTAWR